MSVCAAFEETARNRVFEDGPKKLSAYVLEPAWIH